MSNNKRNLHRKIFYLNLLSLFLFGVCCASDQAPEDLFTKARKAVESKQLGPDYILGIETAEILVKASKRIESSRTRLLQLHKLYADLLSHFPSAQEELEIPVQPITWDEYLGAVERLINWKTPQDFVFNGTPSKRPVNLEPPEYLKGIVHQGFIPQEIVHKGLIPHGFIGEAVILLCLAHNIAPYRFPTTFSDNRADEKMVDTMGFVEHDGGHHKNVYEDEFKRNWVLSGNLRNLLYQLPFTNGVIYYLFDKIWEGKIMDFDSPRWTYYKLGKLTVDFEMYYPEMYSSLFGHSSSFKTREDLTHAIVSIAERGFEWKHLPIIFKHIKNKEELNAILIGKRAPQSPLLTKMKEWGFVYDAPKVTHGAYFLEFLIYLEQQDESCWSLLDVAHSKGELGHAPDACPYDLKDLVRRILDKPKKDE